MKTTLSPSVSAAISKAVLLGCLALLCAQSARAVIIVSENFTGTDAALVRTTSPETGPTTWNGSNGYTFSNNRLSSATTGSGHFLTMDMGIDFFIDNPDIYEMSADVFFNSTSADTRFHTVGFNNGTNTSAGANRTHLSTIATSATLTGRPTIALRANGLVTVADGGAALFSGTLGSYADGNTFSIRLRLDTTQTNWTVNASVYDYTNATETFLDLNGVTAGLAYTYSTNPTLRYMGVSSNVTAADSANSYMDDFLLQTVPVPEPSTYALLLGGMGLLAFLRRRSGSKS